MLSFREALFFQKFSYSFCFALDDFKRPLVIQGFSRVFVLTEIFLRGNARSYIPEKTFNKYS